MTMGIYPKQLAGLHATEQYGAIPFVLMQRTVAGTATYTIPDVNGLVGITPLVVMRFGGQMTGNGAAGDTVQLQTDAGVAISEAIDVSALLLDDLFTCSSLDLTYSAIDKNHGLRIVTASGATCLCAIECLRVEI